MASVQLEQVSKIYDKNVLAVDAATIDIPDKEFVVLVGPSGCGKSTLLRMIAGLEEITSGTLRIDDNIVNSVPPKDRDIAMVFQNYALYPHMTVYENMAFGLKLRKFPKPEIKQRVQEAAAILDLQHLLERKPKALSGGQRQRVALGRAIVRKPKVFLFDEPLSNLDAKLRVQMRTEISKLHSRLETTMIYVTHDQVEAMTMGDRIVVLKDGLVQQVDTPLNLYQMPANQFVAGFIGSPAMNFLTGTVKKEKTKLVFKSKKVTLPIPDDKQEQLDAYQDKSLTLGIRPEDLTDISNTDETIVFVPAVIEVLEPMGNETFLYARVDEQTLIARVKPTVKAEVGKEYQLGFDLTKLHFFDTKEEHAL